jgi:hypothetical protein
MSDDHPTTDPGEDEYGEVDTPEEPPERGEDEQPAPSPGTRRDSAE